MPYRRINNHFWQRYIFKSCIIFHNVLTISIFDCKIILNSMQVSYSEYCYKIMRTIDITLGAIMSQEWQRTVKIMYNGSENFSLGEFLKYFVYLRSNTAGVWIY